MQETISGYRFAVSFATAMDDSGLLCFDALQK